VIRHDHPGPAPAGSGLTPEQLADLLSGAATPAVERQALAHFLATCPTCAAAAALLVESLGLEQGPPSPGR
jgi:anti-sigma factor RsiW